MLFVLAREFLKGNVCYPESSLCVLLVPDSRNKIHIITHTVHTYIYRRLDLLFSLVENSFAKCSLTGS
jgi:hypothetical protein